MREPGAGSTTVTLHFTGSPSKFMELHLVVSVLVVEILSASSKQQGQHGRIAHANGFCSDDASRCAFERRFVATTTTYRSRFITVSDPRAEGFHHAPASPLRRGPRSQV